MPISNYDRWYGGKGKDGARKARRKMHETYGSERGERVFYATMNKRKKQGAGRGLTKALKRRAR